MKRWIAIAALCLAVLLWGAPARAVRPALWSHSTEAHFSTGKFEQTATTSLGEVRLARSIKVLLKSDAAPPVISAVAVGRGAVYAGAGNEAVIYKVQADKAAKFATLPSTMIGCLLWTGRDLLAGTGGEKAGVYQIDGRGKFKAIWTDAKVKYVWAVVRNADGSFFAATGPEGKVFAVDKAGKGQVVYHADKLAKNILCLIAGPDGKLYAGTDEKGLVIEIDPKAKAGRVLMDAPEKEVAALALGEAGALFAATSDASKASADGAKTPTTTKGGKAAATKPAARPAATKPTTKPAAKKPPTKKPEPKKPADKKPPAKPKPPAKKPAPPKDKPEEKPKDKPTGDKKPAEKPKSGEKAGKGAPPKKPAPKPPTKSTSRPAAAGRGAPATRPSGASRRRTSARPMLPVPSGATRIIRPSGPTRPPTTTRPPSTSGKGNAVYLIRPDGLIETVFRRPVTILAMLKQDGKLILGTGNGGGIYTATTDGDEIAQIADTDARQVTSLAAEKGGAIYFGTANKGSIARLEKALAKKGTFVAKAMDAKQIAKWGTIQIDGAAGGGGKITIATRSGNVAEPDEKTWSSWSKEMPLESGFLPIGSPAGRFLQYRLTLTSNGRADPSVGGVRVVYQVGNLPPAVAAIQVIASPKGRSGTVPPTAPKIYRHVMIKAADVNGDKLRFIVAFREIGTEAWITITDKLAEPRYIWDTRGVGDGRYEVRITANDDPSNPQAAALEASRISEPVVIDNAPPTVKDLAAKVAGGQVTVTGLGVDPGSMITSVAYSVDSQSKWVSLLPSDGICDSGSEKLSFRIKDLEPGAHRIAVRLSDAYNNVGYGTMTVIVGK